MEGTEAANVHGLSDLAFGTKLVYDRFIRKIPFTKSGL